VGTTQGFDVPSSNDHGKYGVSLAFVLLSCSLVAQLQVEWSGQLRTHPQPYGRVSGAAAGAQHDANTCTVDPWGALFVTGVVASGPDNGVQVSGPGGAVVSIDSSGGSQTVLARFTAAGTPSWAFLLGGGGTEWPLGITTDGTGAVYLAGRLEYTLDVDPGPDSTVISQADGNEDGYIAKYDSLGHFQYVIHFKSADGTPTFAQVERMACDAMNNLYVIGYFEGNLTLDSGQTVLAANGNWQCAFVAKYDPDGQLLQYLHLRADDSGSTGYDLVVTDDGGVFITGDFRHSIDMDPGPGTEILSGYNVCFFMARYDADFGLVWAHTFNGGWEHMGLLACEGEANGYIVGGEFRGEISVEVAGVMHQYQGGTNFRHLLLMSVNANGEINWFRHFPAESPCHFQKLCAMDDRTFYASLAYSGDFNLDPGFSDLTVATDEPDYDMGFAQYSINDGEFLMGHAYTEAGNGPQYVGLASFDGVLYVTADFHSAIDIAVPAIGDVLTEAADGALAVIKYNSPSLGIHDPANGAHLKVFPIPASTFLQVESGESAEAVVRLIVFDHLGKAIVDQPIGRSKRMNLSVEELRNGPYVLQAVFADGHTERARIIVVH